MLWCRPPSSTYFRFVPLPFRKRFKYFNQDVRGLPLCVLPSPFGSNTFFVVLFSSRVIDKDLTAEVNVQLKKLYDWLCCNKLSLNINKTYYTLFRPPSNVHVDISNKLFINNKPIQMVGETNEQDVRGLLLCGFPSPFGSLIQHFLCRGLLISVH